MGSKVKLANVNAAKREKEKMTALSLSQGQSDNYHGMLKVMEVARSTLRKDEPIAVAV